MRYFLFVLTLVLAQQSISSADEITQPKGEVILSVTGSITKHNAAGVLNFDIEMLKSLGATTYKTATNWTEGERVFTGVLLSDLLAFVGSSGVSLKATALNDYSVEIPTSDAVEGGPIVAYEMDGRPMSLRDKGPLWIVYPYDSDPRYRTETIYSRSIWQLNRIEVFE